MQKDDIFNNLQNYIATEVLEGEDVGLESDTPLLEIGVLNSIEIMSMVRYIEDEFNVTLPMKSIHAENFKNLDVISEMVVGLL